MSVQFPNPVARYFTADAHNAEAVSRCFTDDAFVMDEGHTYRGRAAIQAWKEEASSKFSYTCDPLACEQHEGRVVVTCRVAGNFPGSPVDLRYFFQLAGDEIASLEVLP